MLESVGTAFVVQDMARIVEALGEVAGTVRVGVDQARMHEPMLCVDQGGVGGGGEAGTADLGDRVALDQDVGGNRLAAIDVEKLSAANDGVGNFFGHG